MRPLRKYGIFPTLNPIIEDIVDNRFQREVIIESPGRRQVIVSEELGRYRGGSTTILFEHKEAPNQISPDS